MKNNKMKKLLLLLLFVPVIGLGQYPPDGLVLNDVFPVNLNNHISLDNALTVPENKVWKMVTFRNNNSNVGFRVAFDVDDTGMVGSPPTISFKPYWDDGLPIQLYLFPQGTKIYAPDLNNTASIRVILIYEFSYSNNSLSYNEPKAIENNSNTPVLFPNPTSSLLSLNSDKEYDIEVYDMLGNKLMALSGNSINMEHLSTATYIVKATDKSNNEELTYKVVKN
jgi:hypothetical protein